MANMVDQYHKRVMMNHRKNLPDVTFQTLYHHQSVKMVLSFHEFHSDQHHRKDEEFLFVLKFHQANALWKIFRQNYG